MNKIKRTTVNLPEELLNEATAATGKSITETISLGLTMLKRTKAFEKAIKLKKHLQFCIDLNQSRERHSN